jgi:hypothetical protein
MVFILVMPVAVPTTMSPRRRVRFSGAGGDRDAETNEANRQSSCDIA